MKECKIVPSSAIVYAYCTALNFTPTEPSSRQKEEDSQLNFVLLSPPARHRPCHRCRLFHTFDRYVLVGIVGYSHDSMAIFPLAKSLIANLGALVKGQQCSDISARSKKKARVIVGTSRSTNTALQIWQLSIYRSLSLYPLRICLLEPSMEGAITLSPHDHRCSSSLLLLLLSAFRRLFNAFHLVSTSYTPPSTYHRLQRSHQNNGNERRRNNAQIRTIYHDQIIL